MPGDRDDDDAPRWELPVYDPSEEIPRWEPEREARREVPRWQPRRGQPSLPRVNARVGSSVATPSREVAKPVPLYVSPFVWWSAHPWAVLWVLVLLAPAAVLLLRVLDDASLQTVVTAVAWALALLFVVALALALVVSARRSVLRLVLGAVGAVAALGVVLWPVTRVTLGRTVCPPRAGADLGAGVATGALQAWQGGIGGDDGWGRGQPDGAWRERTRAAALVDYQLVATGCWERVAPIDATRTWHEFRVTVRDGDREPLSKTVVVHTAAGGDGWKITAIEGPLP